MKRELANKDVARILEELDCDAALVIVFDKLPDDQKEQASGMSGKSLGINSRNGQRVAELLHDFMNQIDDGILGI
jgi:hypothetical protein